MALSAWYCYLYSSTLAYDVSRWGDHFHLFRTITLYTIQLGFLGPPEPSRVIGRPCSFIVQISAQTLCPTFMSCHSRDLHLVITGVGGGV